MATNKRILVKGLSYLGWAMPLIVLGPVAIHSSFKNQQHPLFIPVLGVSIIICLAAILLIFRGINTIMKSLFDHEK